MESNKEFVPAVVSHPCETLLEYMEEQHVGLFDLADRCGVEAIYVSVLLEGRESITEEFAEGLAKVFRASKEFWLNLQANYDKYCEISTGEYARISYFIRDVRNDELDRRHTMFAEIDGMIVQVQAQRISKSEQRRMEAMVIDKSPLTDAEVEHARKILSKKKNSGKYGAGGGLLDGIGER